MKKFITILTLFIVSFALYSCAYKESYRWGEGEYIKIVKLCDLAKYKEVEIESAAHKGDTEAMFLLAMLSQDDEEEFRKLLLKSADQGYIFAMAMAVEKSRSSSQMNEGKTRSKRTSEFAIYKPGYLFRLKLLAKEGNILAQKYLAYYYEDEADGEISNAEEAVKWGRMAAEQGDAEAQYALGVSYEKGIGIEKNYKEALKWYQKSSKQGYEKAEVKVIHFMMKGRGGLVKDEKQAMKRLVRLCDRFEEEELNDHKNLKELMKKYHKRF